MMNNIIIVFVVISVVLLIALGYWFIVRPQTQMRESVLTFQQTQEELRNDLTHSRQELQQAKSTIDKVYGFSEASQSALTEVRKETTLLSQAFRSPRQQGNWGELALRKIVEASGMTQHCDYEVQEPVLEKTIRNGTLKLDMVIHLYNQRSIIVDAKAPSDVYLEITNAPNERIYAEKVQAFVRSIRRTVSELAKKEYWKAYQPAPILVIMFLPNEAMFRVIVEHDLSLIEDAARLHVMLASPTTLIALLKTIAYGWSQEQRAQNVQHIIQHSHTLSNELKQMYEDWQKHRKQLEETVKAYNHFTTVYNNKIFPVIKAIQDLDDTLQPSEHIEPLSVLQVALEEPHVNELEKS